MPPGTPFPGDQDPDRTVAYRTPRPPQQGLPRQGPPQQGSAHTAGWPISEEFDPAAPSPPTRKGMRGWIVALVAAIVVGVVGGGGVWAAAKLSGGGTQPHEVLPGNAIAYVRVDLDPAANQKIALFGIARKFSATKETFSGDDPRKAAFEALRGNDPKLSHVDYAKDIEPWLGDRIGFAVLPPAQKGADPGPVLAVQVKDEEAARAGLTRMSSGAAEREPIGVAFRDGYAIVAPDQNAADRYAATPPLSEDSRFTGDMDALGEQGVLSFWGDLAQIAQLSTPREPTPAALELLKDARFAGALRFGDDYAELTGTARGTDVKTGQTETVKLGDLPSSTAAALGVTGLGTILQDKWADIEKALGSQSRAPEQYGLTMPDDLVTLLGKSFTLALDGEDLNLATPPGGTGPKVGTILETDPAKAESVLAKLEAAGADAGQAAPGKAHGDGKLIFATSQDYADKLATAGTLRDSESFQKAVPGAEDAGFALYADLDKLETLYINDLEGEAKANVAVLRAVGLSGTITEGAAGFTLRVVFN
ncbi:DUF3352 domain-containing protein [Sphaerimonospora cavernae]|uniref:DUF3352 domain-containing protein n=1 Tax=Sphaerimonospora cavernae TaxID=1740611 RepID=A0ABV6U3C4_9ACTN